MTELVVIVLRSIRVAGDLRAGWPIRAAVAIAQMPGQIRFAEAFGSLFAGQLGTFDDDIRLDALGLDRAALGV